ncbi:MAG: 4-demethylwyosine synthase TYW1 [Candidatus Hodarchaeales archaeon]|jgi:tRNA wybutosine-synthesizing protein 1
MTALGAFNKIMSALNPEIRKLLKKQKYQLAGKATAVKKCLWNHNALRENRLCYKHHYGIDSHRCMQTAVNPALCQHDCFFCWRIQARDIGVIPDYFRYEQARNDVEISSFFDSPEEVADKLVDLYRRIICGYKPFISPEKYAEAMDPIHVTMSLAGEPLLYPWMAELVNLLKKQGKTVFIVTNGTVPKRVKEMKETRSLPTQFYMTLPAPEKKTYLKTCRPLVKGTWNKIMETLDTFNELVSRTVTRLTVAKDINMVDPKGYARLINRANSSFVEVKGVVVVGGAMKRIERKTMPSHQEIMAFAKKIEEFTDYKVVAEQPGSKVAILSNDKHPLSFKDE